MLKLTIFIFISILTTALPFTEVSSAKSGHDHHHHEKKTSKKKRHVDSHVHGNGTMNFVLEGNELVAEFELPAHDIVGFEHKPKTKAQKKTVRKAISTLKKSSKALSLSRKANCSLYEMSHDRVSLLHI